MSVAIGRRPGVSIGVGLPTGYGADAYRALFAPSHGQYLGAEAVELGMMA